MNDPLTDRYIEQCRQGDTGAFGYIVSRYQQMVYTLAFRLLCNQADAEDTTQDVFIKAWQKIGSYNGRYKFSTWLYKIACNACYDKLRSKRNISNISTTDSDIRSDTDIDESINNKQLKELILMTTEGLTPKQKLMFMLSEIEELEADEIFVITGMTPAKIKSNLYLARKYIKSKLSDYE